MRENQLGEAIQPLNEESLATQLICWMDRGEISLRIKRSERFLKEHAPAVYAANVFSNMGLIPNVRSDGECN